VQQATEPNRENERLLVAVTEAKTKPASQNNTQSVKVIPINPVSTITNKGIYKTGQSWERKIKITNQIMYGTPTSFTILNNISLNTLWSNINRDKNCKNSHSGYSYYAGDSSSGNFSVICDVENSRTKYEFSYYDPTNFISLSRVVYTTCSSGNWEEISKSLISKFSQTSGPTPIEIQIGKHGKSIEFANKNVGLGEFLHAKLGNLSLTDTLNCPGRIALQLTLQIDDPNPPSEIYRLSSPFTEQVKRVFNESNIRDAGVSVPKF
jgi:hypothetical protein